MFEIELDYQISKAIEYINRGGDFEKWIESKDFTQKEMDYIKKRIKIIEKQTEK